jgi:hypothetical protein
MWAGTLENWQFLTGTHRNAEESKLCRTVMHLHKIQTAAAAAAAAAVSQRV